MSVSLTDLLGHDHKKISADKAAAGFLATPVQCTSATAFGGKTSMSKQVPLSEPALNT